MRVASLLLTIVARALPFSTDAYYDEDSGFALLCGKEERLCPDGTVLLRTGGSCEYPPCPETSQVAAHGGPTTCPDNDAKTCPDGSILSRDPELGCEFPECPLVCCDPLKAPILNEGQAKCCGVTGNWVSSIGDGRFKCNGIISVGPDFLEPFGEPCPVECGSIQRKTLCLTHDEHGCRWLGKKQCIHENDLKCEKLTEKRICSRVDKCTWKRDKCINRCPQPDPSVLCDEEEYQLVTCKRGCMYDNMCNARAAGQKARKCKRTCQSNSDCNEKKVCFKGTCVRKTGNTCDGFRGTMCPAGETCVLTPCPPGVMDSCGGHCITDL